MVDVFIFDAVRTPRAKGRPGGGLSSLAPQELVRQLVDALEARSGGKMKQALGALTLGCVGQAGAQGGHIAVVSRVHAGLPDAVRAVSLNNFCVSGMTAIRIATESCASGAEPELQLAGGVEMMSAVPFLGDGAAYYEDRALSEPLRWVPVGLSADLMATMNGYTGEDLNRATVRSHQRAAAAWAAGPLQEVIPMKDADGGVVLAADETIRADTSAEKLSRMPPVFAETGADGYDALMLRHRSELSQISHLHNAGNCPPIADGASLVLLGTEEAGRRAGLTPRARVVAVAEASADPLLQLTAGFGAMEKLLARTGMALSDFDRIEFMEAFAATIVKFECEQDVDMDKVNPEGGHLAMGHPMGATGAILTTTLLSGMERRGGKRGLAVATGGSGVGAALAIERL